MDVFHKNNYKKNKKLLEQDIQCILIETWFETQYICKHLYALTYTHLYECRHTAPTAMKSLGKIGPQDFKINEVLNWYIAYNLKNSGGKFKKRSKKIWALTCQVVDLNRVRQVPPKESNQLRFVQWYSEDWWGFATTAAWNMCNNGRTRRMPFVEIVCPLNAPASPQRTLTLRVNFE